MFLLGLIKIPFMSTKKKIVLMKMTGSATKWSSCFLNQIEITKLDFKLSSPSPSPQSPVPTGPKSKH